MKHIVYIIVILTSIFFQSCVKESFTKPERTKLGFSIFLNSSTSWYLGIRFSDIALKVNEWLSAESQEDKQKIENLYFPHNKLIIDGNKIEVSDLCVINTFGSSLSDKNTKWNLSFGAEGFFIMSATIQNEGDLFTTIIEAPLWLSKESTLTTQIKQTDKKYEVTGDGTCFLIFNEKIDYRITSPLIVTKMNDLYLDNYYIQNKITQGSVEMEWTSKGAFASGDTDLIKASYLGDSKIEINAYGSTNTYPY